METYFAGMPDKVMELERRYERAKALYAGNDGQYDHSPSEVEVARLWGTLVCLLRPRTVLESGTYLGYTACYVAAAFRDMGIDGHVTTLDPSPMEHLWEGSDLESYITFIPKTSRQALPDLCDKTFDMILIDSEHTYQTVMWELYHFDKLLRVGGHILLHDTLYHDGLGAAMTQIYDNPRFEIITFDSPRRFRHDYHDEEVSLGATVIRKIADGAPHLQVDPTLLELPEGSHQAGSVLRQWQRARALTAGAHDLVGHRLEQVQESLRDGTLVREPSGRVYVIESGTKRHVLDPAVFARRGFDPSQVVNIDMFTSWHIPDGDALAD